MASSNPQRLSPEQRRQVSLEFWLLDLLAGTLIGTLYFAHAPDGLSLRTWVFLVLGLVSTISTLALVPGAVMWAAQHWLRRDRVVALVHALAGTVFLVLLYADTRIYSLLRYHFNGAVWNVMLTRGSEDAVHLGGRVWWPVALTVMGVGTAQLFAWRWLARRRLRKGVVALPARRILRPSLVCAAILIGVASIEKTIYAAADLAGDREVPHAAGALPMYPKLRVSQLLPGGTQDRGHPLAFELKKLPLQYPLGRPHIDPRGPRPDVLVVVLDSWRADELGPKVTPHLWERSRRARVFTNHLSGGNGTRFGLFSLLYGLHGSYWFPVLAENRPPVLIDALRELDYDIGIFSSASMSFPEFKECAWAGLEDRVFDDHPSKISYERDRYMAEAFERWVVERGKRREDGERRPVFAFVLIDSPHQPYYSPEGGPFQPAAEALDYLELAQSNAPELVLRVRNRYRNAVHFADGIAERILSAFEASGLAENAVVVVTGDHGEEFQECGFWGHTSNFTPEQLHVPFFMTGPGVEPGTEERLTSHLDFPSTLLERFLGADPADRPLWCLGADLLAPEPDRLRVAAGWADLGLWASENIFRVPIGATGPGEIEVYDRRWRLVPDQVEAVEHRRADLGRLAEQCRRFLAPDS